MVMGSLKSNKDLSHKILSELKIMGYDNFTPRAWNFNNPDSTLWWLVPSTQWSLYKYGKLMLYKSEDKLNIGINIEKGVSRLAGQMLSQKAAEKLCLAHDWIWHKVIDDLKSGSFEMKLKSIVKSINKPLKIYIRISSIEDRSSKVTEFEGLELEHSISFSYSGEIISCIKDEVKGEMQKFEKFQNPNELIDIFNFEGMDWFWIDFCIVTQLKPDEVNKIGNYALAFIESYPEIF